jgi:UDP-GlcNAc:undecaprenyl-phosphate/decaprenyl-phosphate GlcNAc-1-phosphate transferase
MTHEFWLLLIALVAAGAAIPLVLLAERVGRRVGFVDYPRRGEVQRYELPRTGGYGIFLAFWIAVLASFLVVPAGLDRLEADNVRLVGVVLGSLVLIPFAIADDRRRLGPGPQIVGHIVAAMVPVLFGLRMAEIATPLGILAIPDVLAGPLAVLWVVAMINAINLIDSMDGLAGGVTAIGSFVLFIRSVWFGQYSIAVLPLALGATCLGYLTRNWHPSRVILGSSGSMFLGYVLGVVTVIGGVKIGTAFLVLAVPILDVAWVMYRRISQGRSPFQGGDGEHLAHRLRRLGLSDPTIVSGVYGICGVIGLLVLLTHSALPTMEKAYLMVGVVGCIFLLLVVVARLSGPQPTPEPSGETGGPR